MPQYLSVKQGYRHIPKQEKWQMLPETAAICQTLPQLARDWRGCAIRAMHHFLCFLVFEGGGGGVPAAGVISHISWQIRGTTSCCCCFLFWTQNVGGKKCERMWVCVFVQPSEQLHQPVVLVLILHQAELRLQRTGKHTWIANTHTVVISSRLFFSLCERI